MTDGIGGEATEPANTVPAAASTRAPAPWRVGIVWTVLLVVLAVASDTAATIASRAFAGVFAVAGWVMIIQFVLRRGSRRTRFALGGSLTMAWYGLVAFGCYVLFGLVEAIAVIGLMLLIVLWLVRRVLRQHALFKKVKAGRDLEVGEFAKARDLGRRVYDLVVLLLRHHRVKRAVELLESVPNPPPANYYWLIECRLRLAEDAAAHATLEALGAIDTEEARGMAFVAAARLATHAQRPDDALKHLSKFEADLDRWVYIDVAKADALVALGRVDEARPVLQAVIQRAGVEMWQDIIASCRPCAALVDVVTPYR